MFLKLQPFFYSLLFLAGLEAVVLFREFIIYAIIALFLLSFFQAKRIGKYWRFAIIPVIFTVSSLGLLYLITINSEKQAFIFLASGMYYLALFGFYRLSLYGGDKTAKGMVMASALSCIFFLYASAYGVYLNFAIPLYVLMLVYLFVTLLVSFQTLSIWAERSDKKIWIYSFALALIMAEFVWIMNFWPFGYLTTGVIALIIYHGFWDVLKSQLLGHLTRKKAIFNLALLTGMVLMVLLSSKWLPVF